MTDMPVLEDMNKIHTGYADGPELEDTKGTAVDRSLTRISEREVCEFFNEGLKQAAAAAKQMGIAQEHEIWKDVGILCDHIRSQGLSLFTSKGLSWVETLKILDEREKMTASVLDAKRKPNKHFLMQ